MLGAVRAHGPSLYTREHADIYSYWQIPSEHPVQLTQTIRFLVANDMLRGVEVRPGQAEEEERERTKIAMLPRRPDMNRLTRSTSGLLGPPVSIWTMRARLSI